MNTYKVQLWFIIWWTMAIYNGSDPITNSQNAMKCRQRKPLIIRWLWRVK